MEQLSLFEKQKSIDKGFVWKYIGEENGICKI